MNADTPLVYADFNCPWSYLASRRVSALASAGLDIGWRAVEHQPTPQTQARDVPTAQFERVVEEMPLLEAALLPGERLPYALAGFLPDSGAAVLAYAEAYGEEGSGAHAAREALFAGFWIHAIDLDDPHLVRTLIADVAPTRDGRVPPRRWRAAQRRRFRWAAQWRALSTGQVPVLIGAEVGPLLGRDVITWLGEQLLRRGVDVTTMPDHCHSPVT